MIREQIVAEARTLLIPRTPFHHQGRLPGVGCDCIGVLIVVARKLGLVASDFDIKGYPRNPDGRTFLARASQFMTRVKREEMQPGDAIVIRWGRDPQHIGILGDYSGGGLSIIHAYGEVDGSGEVIETNLNPVAYDRKFVAAFRLPKVPA